jgi:transposase-like protein
MAKKASSQRKQFWRELIGRQRTSGLNIARFCEQVGVAQNSFYVWKRRLRACVRSTGRKPRRQSAALMTQSLIPVRLVSDPVQSPASTAGAIEVAWPGGVVLRVPSGCNLDTLRDVFRLLTSALSEEAASC